MHNTYIKILVCEICLVTLDLFGVSDDVTEDCVFSFMNGTDGATAQQNVCCQHSTSLTPVHNCTYRNVTHQLLAPEGTAVFGVYYTARSL